MESLKRQAARILREQKKYKLWLVSFLCLAVLVTAGTVTALTMSGQALNRKEKVLVCKLEAHRHTEQCRDSEGELTCGQADYVVHVHNDDCYGEDGALVCALPEKAPHVHDAACFEEQETLVCAQEESEGHQHGAECYTKVQGELTCGQDGAAHQHGAECYTKVQGGLTCGQDGAGHQHGPECYTRVQGAQTCTSEEEGHAHADECYAWSEELTCGQTEEVHAHTDECYAWSEELTCGQTEEAHTHTDECYAWNEELTCKVPEGEGAHAHTEQCYETETVTICGELELHTHDKAGCYDKDGNLTCEETELLEHVHGEGCFEIIEPDEEETEAVESGEAPENKEASGEAEGSTEALESDGEDGEDAEAEDDGSAEADGPEEDGESTEDSEGAEDTDASEETEADGELQGIANVLTAEGADYTVTATYGEDAGIPEGAELKVREILQGTEEYDSYYRQMLAAMAGEGDGASVEEATDADAAQEEADTEDGIEVSFARFFDITFMVDGEKIEPVPGAAVDIRISYKDAVELGEDATASAVHFAKDGTEVLEADVTEAGEGSDFAFTQDSFSVTSTVVTKAPKKKTTKTLSTTVGDVSFTVIGESDKAFLESDRLVVNEIKDNGAEPESGNNSYRKYLNNSEGAIKKKNNQQDEELEVFSARVFEISIEDGSGRKKQKDNVEVEVRYNNAVTATKAGSAVMVLNSEDGGDVLSNQAVSAGQEVAMFSGMQAFSASAPNVVTTMVAGVELADTGTGDSGTGGSGTGTHTSVEEYLKQAAANDWQIVDEGYKGNAAANKPNSDDKVRVQKNVIPTDVENEFLVYLSIDTKEVLEKYFQTAEYEATTNNSYKGLTLGNVYEEKITSTKISVSTKPAAGLDKSATFNIKNKETGEVLSTGITLYWGGNAQANEVSFYLTLERDDKGNPIKWILLGHAVASSQNNDILFSNKAITEIENNVMSCVELNQVTDPMGSFIQYEEVLAGDYKSYDFDADQNVLYWNPVIKEGIKGEPQTIQGEDGKTITTNWYCNVAELVYKVKLNVTKPDFKSCAQNMSSSVGAPESYPVNGQTVLQYEGGSIEFPIPYIRGLLYDHELTKKAQDKDGKDLRNLAGAVFTATGTAGDGEGRTYTATSDEKGKVLFTDMPWGTYTIEETTVPDGYEKPEDAIPSVELCYTKDKALISDADNSMPQNMIKAGEKAIVINTKVPQIVLKKEWIDDDDAAGKRPKEITFTLNYLKDSQPVSEEIVLNASENWTKTVTVPSAATEITCTEKNVPDKYAKELPGQDSDAEIAGDAVVTDGTIQKPDGTVESVKVYTITNQYKKYSVKILKVEKATGNLVDGAVFDLYDEVPGDDVEPIDTDLVSKDGGVIYEGELGPGDYWLVETGAPKGYVMLNTPYEFRVKESADNTVQEFKVENELAEQKVALRKKETGSTDKYLPSAKFNVYDAPNYTADTEPVYQWESKENGVICDADDGNAVTKLGVGTWYVVETKAPDGYELPANAFIITVSESDVKITDSSDSRTIQPDQDRTYIIEITNTTGAMLPETGGPGTVMYTLGGLAAIATSLVYGLSMRRRKEKGGRN